MWDGVGLRVGIRGLSKHRCRIDDFVEIGVAVVPWLDGTMGWVVQTMDVGDDDYVGMRYRQ